MPSACAVVGCAAGLLATVAGVTSADLALVRSGRSPFVIVRSVNASPSEVHAAKELQLFIEQISGAKLPIRTDDAPLAEHEIMVGSTNHQIRLGLLVDYLKLGDEGYNIRVTDKHISIAGGRLRGTMYGVYGLLEDHLGCRWFASDCSRIPKRPTITLPRMNETKVPILEYREPFATDAYDGDWAARNRMNSANARLDRARGGKIVYKGFVHTFYQLMPPSEFFAEHPEYFSEIDGKRTAEHAQLCLTNPDVARIVTERVKQWLRESPEANIVSVSQNDWAGWCTCKSCKAIDDREGSQAGTMLHFVNQVAEGIEREFPRVAVDTLAYQYTRKPPLQIRPRHNVIVRLCSIECCFAHPLESCPANASFDDDLRGWSKVTDRLYVWDYVTSFSHYINPFPNLRVLQPNIRLYTSNGVKGIFEQGCYNTIGGEFAELRAYVLAKLLWDRDYDVNTAMDEFLNAYYGKAAAPIRQYINLIHDAAADRQQHMNIWIGPNAWFLTDEVIARADRLWAQALALKQDPVTDLRVEVASLPMKYVQIMRTPPGPERIALLDEFMEIAGRKGITRINEWRELADWAGEVRAAG